MTGAWCDPWEQAHRPDPHPLYRRMRERAPVFRATGPQTGRGFWFLTRYADVQRALRDPDLGRDFERLPEALAAPHRLPEDNLLARMNRHVLNLDPPDHTRLRRLMTPAFGTRTIAALEPRIEEITAELLDAIAATGGEVDLIEALALPLPITVIAELLGIPIDDRSQFRHWVEDLLRGPTWSRSVAPRPRSPAILPSGSSGAGAIPAKTCCPSSSRRRSGATG